MRIMRDAAKQLVLFSAFKRLSLPISLEKIQLSSKKACTILPVVVYCIYWNGKVWSGPGGPLFLLGILPLLKFVNFVRIREVPL